MSTNVNPEPAMFMTDRRSKDLDSESPGTPPMRTEDVEKNEMRPVVDPETEKRLLRKLDLRIVPMVMWIYLMNFMDRGMKVTTHLTSVSDHDSQHRKCPPLLA